MTLWAIKATLHDHQSLLPLKCASVSYLYRQTDRLALNSICQGMYSLQNPQNVQYCQGCVFSKTVKQLYSNGYRKYNTYMGRDDAPPSGQRAGWSLNTKTAFGEMGRWLEGKKNASAFYPTDVLSKQLQVQIFFCKLQLLDQNSRSGPPKLIVL